MNINKIFTLQITSLLNSHEASEVLIERSLYCNYNSKVTDAICIYEKLTKTARLMLFCPQLLVKYFFFLLKYK